MNDDNRYEQEMKKLDKEQFVRQMKEATAFLEQGDGASAIPILERLAQLYPDDIGVAINLGGAYILAKQWKLAVEILEIATMHEPNDAAIWSNLGAAYLGTLMISTKDKQDKAIAAFQHAIEINPYYPNAHYNLGLIYEDRGELAEASEMFRKAIQVNPRDQDARNLLARCERALSGDPSLKNIPGSSQPNLN